MINRNIRALLEAHVPRDSKIRPFVTDGDPVRAEILVVGYNPRSSEIGFWEFWSDATGFNKAAFDKTYREKNGVFRGSRLRLNRLREKLGPMGSLVLETNLYWKPTPRARNLGAWSMEPFIELLRLVAPKMVVAHGKKAREEISRALKQAGIRAKIFKRPHFSLISYGKIDGLAKELRSELGW